MGKIKSLFMLLIAAGLFYGAYYLLNQWQESQGTETDSSSNTRWGEVTASTGSFKPSADLTEQNLDNIAEPADWRYYRNSDFGISLNVPQKVLGLDGCLKRKFEVPIAVLEDAETKAIFVVPEYFYEPYSPSVEELRDKSGDVTFEEDDPIDEGDPNLSDTDGDGINDCRKRYYALPLIRKEAAGGGHISRMPLLGNPRLGIGFRTWLVSDTEELNKFLRNVFGKGCVLSKKTAVEGQEGLYKLEIKDGGEKDAYGKELTCATDNVSDIFYNPSKNRIAYALFPESGMFFSEGGEAYDEEIIASVHLE